MRTASTNVMYSAPVVADAGIRCLCALHDMAAPASNVTYPLNDFRSLTSEDQSTSEKFSIFDFILWYVRHFRFVALRKRRTLLTADQCVLFGRSQNCPKNDIVNDKSGRVPPAR